MWRVLFTVFVLGCTRSGSSVDVHTNDASSTPLASSGAIVNASASASATPSDGGTRIANHTLMLALADGKLPFATLVDAHRGVMFVDNSGDPSGGQSPRDPSGVRCGAALTTLLDLWQKRLANKTTGLRKTYEEGRLECVQTPTPACIWRGSSEWDPTVYFLFRADSNGELRLRAIDLEDELLVDPARVAANRRQILTGSPRDDVTIGAGACD